MTTKYLTYKTGQIPHRGSLMLPVPEAQGPETQLNLRNAFFKSHEFIPWSVENQNDSKLLELIEFARGQRKSGRKLMILANSGIDGYLLAPQGAAASPHVQNPSEMWNEIAPSG